MTAVPELGLCLIEDTWDWGVGDQNIVPSLSTSPTLGFTLGLRQGQGVCMCVCESILSLSSRVLLDVI